MLDAGLLAALQQAAGRAGVVAVVLQRIRDRLRHDRVRREVHDRVDAVLAQHAADQLAIAGVADDQRRRAATAERKPVDRLSSTTTFSLRSPSWRTTWLPMYPAPPVTRMDIGVHRL